VTGECVFIKIEEGHNSIPIGGEKRSGEGKWKFTRQRREKEDAQFPRFFLRDRSSNSSFQGTRPDGRSKEIGEGIT